MSLLYNVIERAALHREAHKLIEPTDMPAADPILGHPPEIVYRWNTFGKKHGRLVEDLMTKVIQAYTGWAPASQTRFKCDTDKTKKLIDRIAINHTNGVAIFVECKRNLGNVSGPYLSSINTYNEWCKNKAFEIAKEIGFNPSQSLIRFVVFNAYGNEDDKRNVKGIPVLRPNDLPAVFGLPVLEAFEELNTVVQSVILENEAFRGFSDLLEPPRTDLLTTQEASKIEAEETPEQFRQRISKTLDRLAYE